MPETLELKLTDEEKTIVAMGFLTKFCIDDVGDMSSGHIATLGDAIASAATAKAAWRIHDWLNHVSVKGGRGWDFGERLEQKLEAAGIQKPDSLEPADGPSARSGDKQP